MKTFSLKKIPALAALFAVPVAAWAQFTTPHLGNIPGDVTNALGATTFINHGLVGIGHISASALDSFGETFGSASSLQVTGFTNNGDGSYNGTLNVLPDRGYNTGNFYSHYRARINQVGFKFTPYYGTTNIGGATDLDKLNTQTNQFTFGSIGGVLFTYNDPITGSNSYTTGLDPGTNYATIFGKPMPYVGTYVGQQSPSDTNMVTYSGINKLPLDSEALVLKADGSGYIGDEYGANVYYFNSSKQIVDAIVPPPAFQPHSPTNVLNYTSANPPQNGRRNNQGFEGVSLSPDGTRLFALLQTACVQDGQQSANNQLAKNTRLLVYDVSTNPVPTNAIGEYVLTLPTYKSSGNGSVVDKTCAQSEVVALDNYRFLVLPRDGNGLGNSLNNPNVYKTLLLVDIRVGGPTNIVNDLARNVEGGTITSNGVAGTVDPTITTLSWVEAVNMLNTNQLAKFNVQWDSGTNQVTKLTMGEKWEGVAMVSANDANNPNDYFIFVGNDNDFLTSNGQIMGPDGTIVSYNGFAGYPTNRIPAPVDSPYNENDTRILAFRVTIAPATVVRSVSYNPAQVTPAQLANGSFALVCQDTNGNWVNAVNLNTGGNPQFVFGPYVSSYSLGTYGVDTNAGTVWAVVNYDGSFAAGAVTNRTNFSALRIATLSDIHYMDPSLLIADGPAFQNYLAGDRKLLAESSAIDKAAIDAVIAQQPDILLVNGDETKDGEYVSHIAVSNLLARVAASGTMVYVIPGNHDVNNTNAMSFNGATESPVPNVTPSQFSSIYAPFGYNQAIAKDPNSLAYVVEPVSGLWILCMDSCQYTLGQDPTEGSITPQRLNWITNQLALAQANGKVVVGMMHHGLMEHFVGQKTLFPEYVVDNYQTIARLFASYGMKVVFTGHFHAQDIVQGAFNGNTIYDIETGSTVTYPCPYRLMDLMPNGQFVITTHRITAINYNLGSSPDFQTYAYNYLTNGMVGLSAAMLQQAPFYLDAGTANYLAPAVTEGLVDHYIGDEPGLSGATPATQGIVYGLIGSTNLQSQQIGYAIASILTDLPPADNNLTLNLAAGQITGPATNTIIVSGSPTLMWAPVWGASSYHVTVTGPGYSQSFDVSGTSLALPGNLANGIYTWTVTPNNGTVSSTGEFVVDYGAPTLLGFTDSAPAPDQTNVPPFVNFAYSNQRGDARYATVTNNAGVRVLTNYLALWQPTTLLVDAGVSAPATNGFPAITPSTWSGLPGVQPDGTILNTDVLGADLQYVINVTSNRTSAQALAAYLDDRRGKGYSISDGMGPLTAAWRAATQQTTTITNMPADATSVLYNDGGNNTGVGSSGNATFGLVVDFENGVGNNASTEPAKRFYKHARAWRWTTNVVVDPTLVPAESSTPVTDGGFPSGHEAEAERDALAVAYVVPQRFQEILTRASELGEDRILAGMHAPLDVMGGRMLGMACAAANIYAGTDTTIRTNAYQQAQTTLMSAVHVSTPADFYSFAHSQPVSVDRFADHDANKAIYRQRLTYGFAPSATPTNRRWCRWARKFCWKRVSHI